MDVLEQKVDMLEQKVNVLDQKLNKVEYQVTEVKIILENEIRPNIQRVAEGHLDLDRKLKEAVVLRVNLEASLL